MAGSDRRTRIDPIPHAVFGSIDISEIERTSEYGARCPTAGGKGRQSSQLTARHVMKQFPWDWGEQRRRFAVASEVTDRLTVRDSPASVP